MLATTPASDSWKGLTADQQEARKLLGSIARHIMLYGGSRSGKTFLIIYAIIVRALLADKSRHACFRFRFNHIKVSIIHDTLPKVMDLCFPGLWAKCHLDKQDWFLRFPNGSEIWFGGLDDKERTEKILGQEHATLYFNECSQIPFNSVTTALTRLAQKVVKQDGQPLRLKAYYDCNPPSDAHWTYKQFVSKRDPDSNKVLAKPDDYVSMLLNPDGNAENVGEGYIESLDAMPDRARRRYRLGQWSSSSDNSLWSYELLDRNRTGVGKPNELPLPEMQRIVIAVDPSGTSGDENERSDEIGIVVVGLGTDGRGYVLEDLSNHSGPAEWGQTVVRAFGRHDADVVVAETNYGGAMVGEIVRSAASREGVARPIPFKEVKASRGKVIRAEPISALYEQNKVSHVGYFETLENQLCDMTTAGYLGTKSPDRADALIWALHEIFPAVVRQEARSNRPFTVNLGHQGIKQRLRR